MKKRFAAAVLCALSLIVTGCGGAGSSSAPSETSAPTGSVPAPADPNSSAPAGTTTAKVPLVMPEIIPAAAVDGEQSLTAAEVAKNMGLGISLGNTMEAYEATDCEKFSYKWIPVVGENTPCDYECCWGAPVTTQKMIDAMRDAGFDTIRIPVFWGNMMANDGTYTINAEYIARVKEIVDYCMNAGVYAVVNIHHFDEFIIRRNDLETSRQIFTVLWTQIAEYFKDYPYTLVFEGYNEYLGGKQFNDSGELVDMEAGYAYDFTNAMNQAFVDAVRATGGRNADRVLIVSGYWTNIDRTTSDRFKMPTDSAADRLMVSVHYVDNEKYWQNNIGGSDWLNYIDDQCNKLKKAFTDKNIPVFMGETTTTYPKKNFTANPTYTSSNACLEYVLEKLLDCGFVPVLWDTTDNFFLRSSGKIKFTDDGVLIRSLANRLHA